MSVRLRLLLVGLAAVACLRVAAAEPAAAAKKDDDDEALESIDAAEGDTPPPKSKRSTWNEYDGRWFSIRLAGGLLLDYAGFLQDFENKQQLGELEPKFKVRDFRLVIKGRLKFWSRLSYTLGYMRDGENDVWRFRQTGLLIDIPELDGELFIGRTKEGFSTSKITMGYNLWMEERSVPNDAFLPILADGVRWTAQGFGGALVYNLGAFNETLIGSESYRKTDWQVAGRAVWLPVRGAKEKQVLHLAVEGRYGAAKDGGLQFKSKPECFESEKLFVDTGVFPAVGVVTEGVEAYYRSGPMLFGGEYYFNQVVSDEANNPFLHGGEVNAVYLLTGEVRPYNLEGAFFESITPKKSVFAGGQGAWELALRLSYIDLDSGHVNGGKFVRVTPMVNWYLSDQVRVEIVYGYGWLDRFDLNGTTQFFQGRVQFQLL